MSYDVNLRRVDHEQLSAVTAVGTDTSESHHLSGRKWHTTVEGVDAVDIPERDVAAIPYRGLLVVFYGRAYVEVERVAAAA